MEPKKILTGTLFSAQELCSPHKYETLGRLEGARTFNRSHLFEGIDLAAKLRSAARVP
jgi:hypothetical protein